MLWILIVVLVLSLLAWCVIGENEWLASVPGPRPLPIFGNILEYFGLSQGRTFASKIADIFLKTRGFAETYTSRYKLKVFRRRILNILNPEDAEIILSSSTNIKKSFIYSFLSSWLHEGLLLSDGVKWHARRKILTPAFHFKILKEFSGIIEKNSRKLVQELQAECGRERTDIMPLISKFALHSICETAMGTQLDGDTSKTAFEYKSAIMKMGHMFLQRLTKFWQHSEWIYSHTTDGKTYQKLLKILHTFPDKVIKDRRNSRREAKETGMQETAEDVAGDGDVYMNKRKSMAMLDLLIDAESRDEIDLQGIKEEVDTFMFEGHDTTAMAITYALLLLANHQDVQEGVFVECTRIFSGSSRPASMTDLSEMRYLEACIKEILRLYPSVPFISRTLSEDIQLSDIKVKAGTTCHIHIYDIHRRADLFEEPQLFKPERFLVENLNENRHPFGYVPFSAGPRNCIGQRFAMLELKCVLSAIVRSYRLHPVTRPSQLVFLADLVLRPRDPVYITFTHRSII